MKRAYCYCDRIIALLVLCNFCTLPFVCYSILFFLLVHCCCCCFVWKSIIADFCPSIFSALMPTVRNVQQERPAKVGITKFDTHENGMAWKLWESERETESKSLWVSFASLKCAFWVVSCQYTVIVCIVLVFAQLKSIIFATDNVFCVYDSNANFYFRNCYFECFAYNLTEIGSLFQFCSTFFFSFILFFGCWNCMGVERCVFMFRLLFWFSIHILLQALHSDLDFDLLFISLYWLI